MNQRPEHGLVDQILQVRARDIESAAVQHARTDGKVLTDQVVHRYTHGGEVSSMFLGSQIKVVISNQRLQDLRLNQGELPVEVRPRRIVTSPECIAIPHNAAASNKFCALKLNHRR